LTYASDIWNISSTEYQRINVPWNNTLDVYLIAARGKVHPAYGIIALVFL